MPVLLPSISGGLGEWPLLEEGEQRPRERAITEGGDVTMKGTEEEQKREVGKEKGRAGAGGAGGALAQRAEGGQLQPLQQQQGGLVQRFWPRSDLIALPNEYRLAADLAGVPKENVKCEFNPETKSVARMQERECETDNRHCSSLDPSSRSRSVVSFFSISPLAFLSAFY